MADYCN